MEAKQLYVAISRKNSQGRLEHQKNVFLGEFSDRNRLEKKIISFCKQEKKKGYCSELYDFFSLDSDQNPIRHNSIATQIF